MALRSLLRRIQGPVLLSPSGPRMGPVGHGVSPAAASRFMGSQSQGGPRTPAVLPEDPENLDRLQESLKVRRQRSIDEANKLHEELADIHQVAWLRLAEYKRAVDNLRKLGDATLAVVVAIPVLLIFGSKYQA